MRDASRWAAAALVVCVVGVTFVLAWGAAGRPLLPGESGTAQSISGLVAIVSYGITGAVLIDRRPDLPFGWLLAGTAVLLSMSFVVVLPSYQAAAGGDLGVLPRLGLTASSFAFLPIAVQGVINVRFPAGRPSTWRGALLERAIVVGTVLAVLGGLLGTQTLQLPGGAEPMENPLTAGSIVSDVADALVVLVPLVILLGLVAGIGVVVRFVRAQGLERQQLKWRAVGVLGALALFPFAVTGGAEGADAVDSVLFVATLAVPVMRYRLWSIDTMLRRSAAYALVIATLVLAYVGLSIVGAQVLPERVAAPVAAVAVALSISPLLTRAQRAVDRVFYEDRNDPYRTLSQLLRLLDVAPPGQMLRALVETLAASLRLPYVAIVSKSGALLARSGDRSPAHEQWPLVFEGTVEGFLIAAPRRGEEGFDARDRELLADVARQTGVAVHAERLRRQLLLSRQRLVTAREEERRRLRRDLHDGLGPMLTAVGLNLDAARSRLAADPEAAYLHVAQAKSATTQALGDLRRLVHGLRPPALDELGLVAAIRAHGERLHGASRLDITVEADALPALPAAIEVAVFRSAVEALTNAVRHGAAAACRVHLSIDAGELRLLVEDDGTSRGMWTPGVGLTAMRERADELGGTIIAGSHAAGGRVEVRMPMPMPEADL